MKKRLISLLLILVTVLGMIPAFAANTEDEALGAIDIINGGRAFSYLAINGQVKTQKYTYYNYVSSSGQVKEIPAYCVNPMDYGVPQTVAEGESIEYLADEKASDPKVVGIIANGYPTTTLAQLGLDNKYQAYYATKMALWCYLISSWDINNLTVNPNLTGNELVRAEKMLAAAQQIYRRGTAWTDVKAPSVTCTPDQDVAYDVEIDGKAYKQQVFTFWSKTWICNYAVDVVFTDPDSVPEGTRIVDMNNNDITTITTSATGGGYVGQFKVLYPAESVEGQTGNVQLSFSTQVYAHAVFYAVCAETDKYGKLQNYVVDTDPTTNMRLSAYSKYSDDGTPPDTPEDPADPVVEETALRIVKYETGTTIPLEGAMFEVIDPDGATVGTFSTDRNGEIVIPLTIVGNYTVIERNAPQYYLISEEPAQNVTVVYGETAEVVFENDPYGNLRVEKVSSSGENLSGAVITVQHIESGQTYSATTNSAGVAMFTELQPGGYRIQEKTAPAGYVLNHTVYTTNVNSGEISVISIVNEEKPGLRIIKYDSKNLEVLSDITFEIFRDGKSIGKYKTNQLGEIVLTDLTPGTYLVQEVATDSTHIINSTPQQIELSGDDGILELIFLNDQKPGIHLVKLDATTLQPLSNATFRVEHVGGTFSKEYVTGKNGEVDLTALEPGTYTVTELSSPDGYLIDDAVRTIQINCNENAQFVFTNTRKPALRVVKLDSATSELLPGATFRIAKIEDGSHYLDRITDTKGEINISNLEPGVYSVVEMDAPDGYVKDSREYHVELFPGKVSELVVSNDQMPDLEILKTDATTGAPVSGVTFTVKKVDSSTLTTVTSDQNGRCWIENLDLGVYEVWEQSVPDGYILNEEHQLITLVPNRVGTVQFQNYPKPTLTIHKIDLNGKALAGAIFELRTKSGVKIGDFPVDKNGTVTIDNTYLSEGYYIITEIQAPEGYVLDKTPHEVYLRPGRTTEISIENEKKPDLMIEKIDSVVGDGVEGAKFEIWVSKDKNQNGTYQKLNNSFYYTDENGHILLDNLDTGWYKITEVEPPSGYMQKAPSEQTVYVDNDSSVTVTFENIPKSALVIRKVSADTGTGLADAWFRVRYLGGTSGSGGTIIGEYATSNNGNIILTGLDAGTYIVEEISAPDGYVIDAASQTAYISGLEQDCITLTFTNSAYGSLLIKKVDAVTNEPLSDVQFFVTDSDGSVVGNANGYFTTDSAGTILISDIEPGTTLVVKETRTRSGYVLDNTPQTIKILSNETVSLEFRNMPKGGLVINKIDSETGEPLSGVKFKITTADGTLVAANEGMTSTNGLYTTDRNGQIILGKLAPDTYIVTEVETLDGYILNAEPQTVAVHENDTQTLTFTNTPKGSLLVTKVDSVTKEPLSGVTFKIAGCNGCEYPAGTYTTDSNGNIRLNNIPSGCYAITETKAKDGYLLDNTTHTVKVVGGTCKEVTFENTPLGGLIIKKMDSATKEPLAGAIFKVTTSDGAAVGSTGGEYRTDERGYISIPEVAPGGYIVREVQAPTGYLLDDTPKSIQIKDHKTYELEFFNQPMGGLVIHKLDSVTREPLEGVQFKITYADGRVVDMDNGQLSSNGLYRTDENGQIKISGITGTFVVTEMETIEGYSISEDTRSQTVVINPNDTQTLYFYNDPNGGLLITKVDSVTKEPLSGVEFKIAGCNGCDYPAGTYTTDSNGTIRLNGIPSGYYSVTETKAKDGYLLDNTSRTVKVVSGSIKEVTFENTPLGGLVIKKMDSTTKEPLAGAIFKVTTTDGAAVGTTGGEYRTNYRGYIAISDLEPGGYVVREVQAPAGYLLDDTAKTIQIKDHKTYELEFFNQPMGGLIIHKMDSVTKTPLEGVQFKITYANGSYVDADSGQLSSNGLYWTDENGQIKIDGITGTLVVTEMETINGYTIHEESRSQTVVVNANDTQSLYFYNDPIGGVEIIKVNEADKTDRIPNVTFEIRRVDDELVDTVTTDANGRVFATLEDGAYYATEIEAAEGFQLDNTPHYFEVENGKTSTLTITNKAYSGILIHKVDANTGDGIYGVTFLLYDSGKNPIGQYTSDQDGWVYINDLPGAGRYYIRELENEGYIVDTQLKTVYVKSGETTEITWENTAITGQIQITKTSEDYNSMNGWPAGTPIPNTVFEIYSRSGRLVDTIKTDKNGVAISKPLPLGHYQIIESQSADFYGLDKTPIDVEIEFAGQIVKAAMTNKSLYTNVSIKKVGYTEVMPGQSIRYDFSGIANNSTTLLTSFYWRDTLPSQAVRLDKIVTGTYNVRGNYKIVYMTNLSNGAYRTLADNLNTMQNYVLDASPTALGLAANEYVTEFMVVFGVVPSNFRQVEAPRVYCTVCSWLTGGTQFTNQADVGGIYNEQWIMATSRWVTKVYKPSAPLPKTGY